MFLAERAISTNRGVSKVESERVIKAHCLRECCKIERLMAVRTGVNLPSQAVCHWCRYETRGTASQDATLFTFSRTHREKITVIIRAMPKRERPSAVPTYWLCLLRFKWRLEYEKWVAQGVVVQPTDLRTSRSWYTNCGRGRSCYTVRCVFPEPR